MTQPIPRSPKRATPKTEVAIKRAGATVSAVNAAKAPSSLISGNKAGVTLQSVPIARNITRLNDHAVNVRITQIIKTAKASPSSAQAYLIRLGTMTPSGKLARKYGGGK
jgi:hypothetical protein